MFEQLVSEAASRFNISPASVSSLMRGLLALVADERSGGPEGFVNLFRHAALGDVVSSWFGGKEGRTITPAHLETVLGPSRIDTLAASSGLSRGTALSVLAFVIPKVVGRLTPGVRMLALNAALGGVAVISAAAESMSARTYGSASARGTYTGAATPNVSIGIFW